MENQLVGSSKSLHFLGPRHRCRWSPQSRWKFSAAMAPYGTGSRSQGSTESTFFSSYLRRNVVPCGTWGLPKGFKGWEMMGIPWSSNVFTKWWGNSDESFLEWWAALFLDTISEQPQGGNHVSLPATFVSSAASVKKIVSIIVSVQYFSANHSYTWPDSATQQRMNGPKNVQIPHIRHSSWRFLEASYTWPSSAVLSRWVVTFFHLETRCQSPSLARPETGELQIWCVEHGALGKAQISGLGWVDGFRMIFDWCFWDGSIVKKNAQWSYIHLHPRLDKLCSDILGQLHQFFGIFATGLFPGTRQHSEIWWCSPRFTRSISWKRLYRSFPSNMFIYVYIYIVCVYYVYNKIC